MPIDLLFPVMSPCKPCLNFTFDYFSSGSMLVIIEQDIPFSTAQIILTASGAALDFDDACSLVPIFLMTTDETVGRISTGDCQPVCSPVKRCELEDMVEDEGHFMCECLSGQCYGVALHVSWAVRLPGATAIEICLANATWHS